MKEFFTWKKSDIEGLPDIAVMPCGHYLGKFNGTALQCCICSKEYYPPE